MADVIASAVAFGLIGIAVLMCVALIFAPLDDQEREDDTPASRRHPRDAGLDILPCSRPTTPTAACSCVAFGTPKSACMCAWGRGGVE